MARKSKADRVHEILLSNPALSRDDPRISELINAEALLRKAQREARTAPVTVMSAAGTAKRSPELVAVDRANTMVRRLRNDLGIDRLSIRRSEDAGIKVKRTKEADTLLALYGPDYATKRILIPGLAAFIASHGLAAVDMPEHNRQVFEADLAEQSHLLEGLAERIKA